ncbi:MAG: hypothetical protein C5B51_31465 [Terriglobia bacterium]|nr:MAG: hypothetical protein C5B51_31465 [Terriglobia bacterium]
MKTLLALALACAPAFAAITGTVINGTTGQPQSGITVSLMRMGQAGPEPAGDVKADAQGKFKLDQPVQGPTLVRATVDGVTYNKVLVPGTPSENITLEIYNSSKQPGESKVSKHMILLEPTGQEVVVNEAYIVSNTGKTAWNDPADGTLHFFLPAGAQGKVQVGATPPGGQPLPQTAQKTNEKDVYKINFAMRPGDTRVDLTYSVPYKEGATYAGKVVSKDDNTYLIVPNGVTLKGDNLGDLGAEPRTQAHIYGLKGNEYEVQLTGSVSTRNSEASTDSAGNQDGSPPIQQIMPRLYTNVRVILPLALGILALGFVLLYRAPVKETNERGRR